MKLGRTFVSLCLTLIQPVRDTELALTDIHVPGFVGLVLLEQLAVLDFWECEFIFHLSQIQHFQPERGFRSQPGNVKVQVHQVGNHGGQEDQCGQEDGPEGPSRGSSGQVLGLVVGRNVRL